MGRDERGNSRLTSSRRFVIKFYCMKYGRFMSKQERANHDCHNKKRGKNRGKWCSLLIKMPQEVTVVAREIIL